ncbi:MAG TPA: GH3 auxin-responsive promoter family protein, partial [Flavobacteriaceae bacterium]|nr:GH3 auxin-responsive promoter family protein [Flavobacteriaceae bacterium]
MGIPLVNSIASWLLRKRLHQIETFIEHPIEVQNELLKNLLRIAKDTEIGKKYDFASMENYQDFSQRIPITTYEDIEPIIERARRGENNIFWPTQIKWFAKSSGTTSSKSKFIPVSVEALEDCHYEASKDLLCLYLNNNPDAKLFDGKGLRLGGSKELYKENGTV